MTLRRLIDLPGVRDLEAKALMKPRMGDVDARPEFPEIDALIKATFGLTADEADDVERPAGWDRIDRKPERDQVAAFEAAGWDVTDDRRRPLRTLIHFSGPMWLAVRGAAGSLPFVPDTAEDDAEDRMRTSLAAEAARFRRDRRQDFAAFIAACAARNLCYRSLYVLVSRSGNGSRIVDLTSLIRRKRLNRLEYWIAMAILAPLFVGSFYVFGPMVADGPAWLLIGTLVSILLLVGLPLVQTVVRRLHDAGRSGYWLLFVSIGGRLAKLAVDALGGDRNLEDAALGVVLGLFILTVGCLQGEPWPNAYGPPSSSAP